MCSGHAGRKAAVGSSELTGKSKSQSKKLYRASVALTPTPPVRAGAGQHMEGSEELADFKPEVEHKLEKVPLMPSVDEIHKTVEQEELQQVIREVRREGLRSRLFEQCLLKPKDRLSVTLGHWGFPSQAKAPYCYCTISEGSELVTRCSSHSCILVQSSRCFFSDSG